MPLLTCGLFGLQVVEETVPIGERNIGSYTQCSELLLHMYDLQLALRTLSY